MSEKIRCFGKHSSEVEESEGDLKREVTLAEQQAQSVTVASDEEYASCRRVYQVCEENAEKGKRNTGSLLG